MPGAKNYYLSNLDLLYLQDYVRERSGLGKAYDTNCVIEGAQKIKEVRVKIAVRVLDYLNGSKYTQIRLQQEINPPSRSWVNSHLLKIAARLFYLLLNKKCLN